MGEHCILKCKSCFSVIAQCRCFDCNKTVKYDYCKNCLSNSSGVLGGGLNHHIVDIEDIKQNGLSLDSPLLWAFLPAWVNWVATTKKNKLLISGPRQQVCKSLPSSEESVWMADESDTDCFSLADILTIKIDYTGDWRDSLTKRPEGM